MRFVRQASGYYRANNGTVISRFITAKHETTWQVFYKGSNTPDIVLPTLQEAKQAASKSSK